MLYQLSYTREAPTRRVLNHGLGATVDPVRAHFVLRRPGVVHKATPSQNRARVILISMIHVTSSRSAQHRHLPISIASPTA